MRHYLIILLLGVAGLLQAQQDVQYTQFMFNKLALNPGYAVSTDYPCISCLHRSQWLGLEGAPTSQSFNIRFPMYERKAGFGLSINHDNIGPTDSWSLSGIYAYRFPMGKSNLGVGLQGTIRSYSVDWSEPEALQSGDGIIPTGITRRMLPNFGVGLYLSSPKYYVGLSVPHILNNDLSFFDSINSVSDFNNEQMHAFLMAGMVFEVNKNIDFKPALLMKYTQNTPFDMDIHGSLIFYDKVWAGLTYRLGGLHDSVGESLDAVVQLQITQGLRLGIAYDFTLSRVRTVNSGTYEVMLDYCFSKKGALTNPRFF